MHVFGGGSTEYLRGMENGRNKQHFFFLLGSFGSEPISNRGIPNQVVKTKQKLGCLLRPFFSFTLDECVCVQTKPRSTRPSTQHLPDEARGMKSEMFCLQRLFCFLFCFFVVIVVCHCLRTPSSPPNAKPCLARGCVVVAVV